MATVQHKYHLYLKMQQVLPTDVIYKLNSLISGYFYCKYESYDALNSSFQSHCISNRPVSLKQTNK